MKYKKDKSITKFQAETDKKQSEEKEKIRAAGKEKEQPEDKKGLGRADIDEEDMQESFFRWEIR